MVDRARKARQLTVTLLDENGVPIDAWQFDGSAPVTIGRDRAADIRLDHGKVSRRHAAIRFDGSEWQFECAGQNGVFMNGAAVPAMTLTGEVDLEFTSGGPVLRFTFEEHVSGLHELSGDVSQWLDDLQGKGSEGAAAELYNRYFGHVARYARTRLAPGSRRVTDEEDVAQSVMHSLFDGLSNGRFPELRSRNSLWRLLIVMTARKAINNIDKAHAKKRGGGNVRGESVFALPEEGLGGLDRVQGDAETPSLIAELAEESEKQLRGLASEGLRKTVELKMAGYKNSEIAEELGVNMRTVERRLGRVRELWSSKLAEPDQEK